MTVGPNEGSQSTYPASWDDLPGTKTQAPGPEHDKAVAQEYTLDDGGTATNPVGQGEHVRPVLPGAPASTPRT
jgi:hypothetical protein